MQILVFCIHYSVFAQYIYAGYYRLQNWEVLKLAYDTPYLLK